MSASTDQPPVLLLTHEFYPKRGGIATYAEEMARAAIDRGREIEVWASDRGGMLDRKVPFPLRAMHGHGDLGWAARRATARFLRAHREQVERSWVYLPEPGPIFAFLYASLLGIPRPAHLALTLHGTEILRFARPPHRRCLFNRLLTQADRVGVVSEHVRGLLLQHFPETNPAKLRVVPGALRHDFAQPPPRRRPVDGKTRVITVGRIHPRKGQHFVMNALARLPEPLRAQVEYHVVGPAVKPAYANELKATAQRAGVPVVFVGEVDDTALAQHYADADIFAMTSVQSGISVEGFGLVYLEAAVCGLPVVAHRTGGVAEAVRHGQSGFVVEPGDEPALTNSFARLIESPDLRQQMAQAGQARAAELSWAANVQAQLA